MKRIIAVLSALVFVSTACAQSEPPAIYQCESCVLVQPTATNTATPRPTSTFTATPSATPSATATAIPTLTPTPRPTATGAPVIVTIFYQEDTEAIIGNPEIGFQTTRRTKSQVTNPRNFPITMATFRTCANQINPSPGVFNWSEFDNFLTAAAAQGQTVQIGLIMGDPFDCGGWMKNYVPGFDVYCSTENSARTYWIPDWNAPATQARHLELQRAFGARYGNDPRVDSADIRSAGDYGEHHYSCVKYRSNSQQVLAPSEAARRQIQKDYRDSFPNKPLLIILDDFYQAPPLPQTLPVGRQDALTYGLGWRADCWGGHHETDLYPIWLTNPDMREQWRVARVDLEPCEQQWITGDMCLKADQAIAKHVSAINTKNLLSPTETQLACFQKLQRKMGYRFVLLRANIGSQTTLTIKNVGIAPNYSPLTFTFAGENKVVSEKILPGTSFSIAFAARSGTLTASLNGRTVTLANRERTAAGIRVN